MVERAPFFNELEFSRLDDDWQHMRPALESFVDSESKQINESHEFFYIAEYGRHVDLQKGLKLDVQYIFDCSFGYYFLFGFFVWLSLLLCFGLLAKEASDDAFFVLGLFGESQFFLQGLLFVPRGVVVDDLGMGFKEVMLVQVLLVASFDSLQGIVLRVEIVADLQIGLCIRQHDLPVFALLEKQVQHQCQNARLQPLLHDYRHCLKLKQRQIMNANSSLAEDVAIVMPKSTIRTVSLEKLRQPSPLSNHNTNSQNTENKQEKESKRMYQKIIDKKINGKANSDENKDRQQMNSRHLITKKFQQLRQDMNERELKQCTFKPQINPTEKGTRSVNQFFNDQLSYRQRKNDKVEQMRIILENNRQKENTFRPNALLNREKPGTTPNSSEVYERLYQDSRNKDKKDAVSRQESAETLRNNSITSSKRFRGISRGNSSQKINKSTSKKESIPSLTSREFHKQSINSEHMASELSAITTRKTSTELGPNPSKEIDRQRKDSKHKEIKRLDVNILQKKDNSKNEEIYIGKLMKEMAIVISKCGLPLVFSYMEMNLFLEKMNFLANSTNIRRLVYEIWNMLQGEIFKEVSALSVMKIVYAIMGCHNVLAVNKCIYDHWLSDSEFIKQQELSLKAMGKHLSYKQNMLMLTERDSKTIRQSYEELHVNRMKAGQSQLLKQDKGSQYSFKPTISKASEEYAERYRNRMLSETQRLLAQQKISYLVPQSGEIDHVDLLMLDEKRKEAVLQQKREEKEKEQRRLQDEALLNPHKTQRESSRSSRNIEPQRDRNQELYQLAKNCHQNKKDKSTDQIEEEKWKHELTFKPAIKSKQNILHQLNSKQNYIPDYDKAVYRMQQARKSKQSGSRPKSEDISPLLYLNVVMEGSQSVKVPVYKDDSMKSITEKVRVMMQLDNQGDNSKLQKILKMQILPALREMNIPSLMQE